MRIYSVFNSVLGDSSPFAPGSKMIAPAIVAGSAAGLGSIASSLLGGIFGSSANRQNVALQRETNEQNYKIFKENQAWQEDMWNKQNEYNLPENQVQRLLAAGINPSSVFGNGSATPAGAVGGVSSPTMHAPGVNPYQPQIDTGSAVNAYQQSQMITAQRKKLNAETAHTELVTEFERKSMVDRLSSLQHLAKRDDYIGQIAKVQLEYEQAALYWKVKSAKNDVALQQDEMRLNNERIYAARLQNGLYEVQLAYAPKLNEAQLKQYYSTVNQLNASIGLINANKLYTDEQRKHEIEKRTSTIIENGLKGFDYEIKKQVKNYVIRDAVNNSEMLDFNRRNQKTLTRFNMFSSVIPLINGFNGFKAL